MIQSFRDKETEKIFRRELSKKLPHDIQRLALRKLLMINAAHDWHDLKVPPGNRLEELRGDRKGQYSIRIHQSGRGGRGHSPSRVWSSGNMVFP